MRKVRWHKVGWLGWVLLACAYIVHSRATATSIEQATAILVGVLVTGTIGLALVLLGFFLKQQQEN